MLLLDVDYDAAFVAIEIQEARIEAAALGTPAAAHRVAFRRFNFHHVGAQVAQQLRAKRPRYHLREIENSNTSERPISHTKNTLDTSGENEKDTIWRETLRHAKTDFIYDATPSQVRPGCRG